MGFWEKRDQICAKRYLIWDGTSKEDMSLDMNIQLPLFWSTGSLAWGQDLVTCAGLVHELDKHP